PSPPTRQWHDGSRLRGRDGGRGLGERFPYITLVHDPIAPVDAGRLVAGDLHGDGLTHARALEVAHGRAPQVVEQQAGDTGRLAGRRPRLAERADGAAVAVKDEISED